MSSSLLQIFLRNLVTIVFLIPMVMCLNPLIETLGNPIFWIIIGMILVLLSSLVEKKMIDNESKN